MATATLAAERAGAGAGCFVIGAPAFKDAVAAAGLELLDGEAGREARAVVVSGHRGFDYEELLTATLALQRGAMLFATSRDPTLPMPGGAWPGTGAILAAVETATEARRRDRRQAGARISSSWPASGSPAPAGSRWSATGSPPTSRAGGGPAWRRSSSSAAPATRGRGGGSRAAARPRRRRPRGAARMSEGGRRRPRSGPAAPSPGSSPSPSAACSRSARCCRSCPATSTARSTAATSRSASSSAPTRSTGLLLRPVAGRYADRSGRRADGPRRLAAGRRLRLPLPAAARDPRPDPRPPRARRRRGHRLHRRLGLDRRPRPARPARPGDRPLRPRGLGRAQRRPADRRAAPARLRLHAGLDLRRARAAGREPRSPRGSPTPTGPRPGSSTSTSR